MQFFVYQLVLPFKSIVILQFFILQESAQSVYLVMEVSQVAMSVFLLIKICCFFAWNTGCPS